MSEALEDYKHLEDRLVRTRWVHSGLESSDEEDILAEMDGAWSRLTAKEQAELSAQPARSLLSDGKLATRKVVDEDVWTNRDRSTRRKEVA